MLTMSVLIIVGVNFFRALQSLWRLLPFGRNVWQKTFYRPFVSVKMLCWRCAYYMR